MAEDHNLIVRLTTPAETSASSIPDAAVSAFWAEYASRLPRVLARDTIPEAMARVIRRSLAAAQPFLAVPAGAIDEPWRLIETLPNTEDLVIAYCPPDAQFPDGRQMIWRASMLFDQFARIRSGIKQPSHLAYPATYWRPMLAPPAGHTPWQPVAGDGETS